MITIKRFLKHNDGTFSTVHLNDKFIGFGLEPNTPILPDGCFSAIKYESPRNKCTVLLFEHIPDHTMVEIHPGNTYKDTEGCIIIGDRIDLFNDDSFGHVYGVGNSKRTLKKLLSRINNQVRVCILG